jgi:hypothetical protein
MHNNKYISEVQKSKQTEVFILKKDFDRIYHISYNNYKKCKKIRINESDFFGIFLEVNFKT